MDIRAFGGFHGHSGLIQVVGRGGFRRRGRCRGRPSGAAAHPAGEPAHAGHPTCKVCWVVSDTSTLIVYRVVHLFREKIMYTSNSMFCPGFINYTMVLSSYYKTELQTWCQRNVFPEQMGYPEVPLLLGQSDSSAEWLT